jgi:anti-anti-sigma regulatory factor
MTAATEQPDAADAVATTPGDASSGVLRLAAACTIREAADLRGQLLSRLEAGQALQIDGSQVERIDTAGVQLLVAFAIDCMERGIVFAWSARSPALEDAVGQLGVAALLESPGASVSFAGVGA